jgi:glucose-1-phosphate adenylyltransferase
MGSDFYQTPAEYEADVIAGNVPIGIGENTIIRKAIVDKNARIGKNVKIINRDNVDNVNREDQGYTICGGIVVILKGAIIADGTVI